MGGEDVDITSVDHLFKRLCCDTKHRNGQQLEEKNGVKRKLFKMSIYF